MKVLQVFNQYRSLFNGEEAVVLQTRQLHRQHGIESPLLMPSSRDISQGLAGKAAAFFGGIYNVSAGRRMAAMLRQERPDIVHSHNVYPLLSPAVLAACRKSRVPVVLSIHNQGLTCPTADHLHAGQACEKCYGGKEHHCLLQNCRGNLMESLGYALRSSVARRLRLFARNVTLFVALSHYARQRLIGAGYNSKQIVVLPNMVQPAAAPADPAAGAYVSFAGRLSAEKDVPTLLAAAGKLPELQVRLAGGGPLETSLLAAAPGNAQLVGRVATEDMPAFYRGARCHVLCSNAFEMCPLTILEAMSQGVPVVASAIGGVDELVEDGVTGLLFEPGNAEQLAEKLKLLWHDDQLCRRLGAAAAQRVRQQYSPAAYFQQLMSIYREAAVRIHGALPRCFEAFPQQQPQHAVQETAV